jgi:hypothetical protein
MFMAILRQDQLAAVRRRYEAELVRWYRAGAEPQLQPAPPTELPLVESRRIAEKVRLNET